jgi:hypothetical protein
LIQERIALEEARTHPANQDEPKPQFRNPNPFPGVHIDYNYPEKTLAEKRADHVATSKYLSDRLWKQNPEQWIFGRLLCGILVLLFGGGIFLGLGFLVLHWQWVAIAYGAVIAAGLAIIATPFLLLWILPPAVITAFAILIFVMGTKRKLDRIERKLDDKK